MTTPSEEQVTTRLAQTASLATPTCPRISLVVVSGPDADRRFELSEAVSQRAHIGTSQFCEVVLQDRSVSRRHASLLWGESGLRLTDLDSRNGTWVNGVRIVEVLLAGGESVRLGDTTLEIRREGNALPIPASAEASFGRVVGASAAMRLLYPRLSRIAATDLPALIEGESGTGKEAVAEAIHDASPRARGPFVIFDAASVATGRAEVELFGEERGQSVSPGLLEQATGGTLFIDEVGDLDLPLQAKLSRALERRQIRRVGSTALSAIDVRIMCGTRRDLEREVQGQRFSDDLYYRLAVARVELPPLRRRAGDISYLAKFFWLRAGGAERALTPELLERLERHTWPGNVRELQNAVVRAVALGEFESAPGAATQGTGDFLESVLRSAEMFPRARDRVLAEFERRYVDHMLALHDGNVTHAAKASGIGRRYFQVVRARTPSASR